MELHHGGANSITAHVGICLTDDYDAAAVYATDKNCGSGDTPVVATYDLDLTGLTVVEVAYDYDECEPVIPAGCTADVVTYEDDGANGYSSLDTWKLLTDAAVASLTPVAVDTLELA